MSQALALAGAVAAVAYSAPAQACGGFFCSAQPVDQTAERILFEVGQDTVTMTTQISFAGDSDDFAWILPLPEVPDENSLAVFSQRALAALDARTGPVFNRPYDCQGVIAAATGSTGVGGATSSSSTGTPPPPEEVTVHIRAEVGNYEVVVIESQDPTQLIEWLRTEDYRVTAPMEPYIELYTSEGMKFLALKLLDAADVSDITPFRFTLPGSAPSIPLRITSIAAEPEMSILVFVLSDQRFEGKNWENLTIDDGRIRFDGSAYNWPVQTNWTSLVAQEVDAAGGRGWVTEFAGDTAPLAQLVQSQIDTGSFQSEEDEEAANLLAGVLGDHPYMTRLYTRMSAEEMTIDPILGRSDGEDVSQNHQLERYIDGEDQCNAGEATDPCEFVTCGAGGICRTTLIDGIEVAGCGCVPGATARTTFAPDGSATVICQDQRLSFLNPGDQEAGNDTLPDPCASFSCGDFGRCVPINMTPTCVCDQGYVATGSIDESGQRSTACSQPIEAIPNDFYDVRLPELPAEMPGGKEVDPPPASSSTSSNTTSSASGGSSSGGGSSVSGGGSGGTGGTGTQPRRSRQGGGCVIDRTEGGAGSAWWLALAGAALWRVSRRRSRSV